VDALIQEFTPDLPAGSVVRCVARCTRAVAMSSTPAAAVAPEVEQLARRRLEARLEGPHDG
jgi:hypothetical protein